MPKSGRQSGIRCASSELRMTCKEEIYGAPVWCRPKTLWRSSQNLFTEELKYIQWVTYLVPWHWLILQGPWWWRMDFGCDPSPEWDPWSCAAMLDCCLEIIIPLHKLFAPFLRQLAPCRLCGITWSRVIHSDPSAWLMLTSCCLIGFYPKS